MLEKIQAVKKGLDIQSGYVVVCSGEHRLDSSHVSSSGKRILDRPFNGDSCCRRTSERSYDVVDESNNK